MKNEELIKLIETLASLNFKIIKFDSSRQGVELVVAYIPCSMNTRETLPKLTETFALLGYGIDKFNVLDPWKAELIISSF
jgi:hypothetical protein